MKKRYCNTWEYGRLPTLQFLTNDFEAKLREKAKLPVNITSVTFSDITDKTLERLGIFLKEVWNLRTNAMKKIMNKIKDDSNKNNIL
jgi:hypothetical protein